MLRFLAIKSRSGIPVVAVLWQAAIVFVLLFTATFKEVLVFVEFLLLLSAALTVGGVFWLRMREPELKRPLKAWGYPFTPALFIGVSVWMMIYVARAHPMQTWWGVGILLVGIVLYQLMGRGEVRGGGPAGSP
jgi:APA family basic amino acid/polyamine antiporter